MSLSDTLRKYKDALEASNERQSKLYETRRDAVSNLYDSFLKGLIRRYEDKFSDTKWVSSTADRMAEFFGKRRLSFLAVDGTSDKVNLEEYAVFFAASYGVRGNIALDDRSTEYVKRQLNEELSMVAYVPVPFAELGEVTAEEVGDEARFSMAEIHNRLMLLAELYLVYSELNSKDNPDVILWDQSFSGMFHWVAPPLRGVPMVENNYPSEKRALRSGDAIIARSHPFNSQLNVPSSSRGFYNLPSRIIYELSTRPNHAVDVKDIVQLTGENESEVKRTIGLLLEFSIISMVGDKITLLPEYHESWTFCVELVDSICQRLFRKKDPQAMIYGTKWITTVDIDFMMSILLRVVVELSWKKNVLLIGIVKDSGSKYFIRNYLGVLRNADIYSGYQTQELFNLLWTDRLSLESLMEHDQTLNAPWSTVEFDSVFQVAFLASKKGTLETMVRGVPSSERIFARSLALFFSLRRKGKTTYNHLLFVDRALIPSLDREKISKKTITGNTSERVTELLPFLDLKGEQKNEAQDFVVFILKTLTRNRFADVIGYPEPLHRADLGAKTFNRMVQPLIRSSTNMIKRSKPWLSSVRQKRRFR